MNETQNKPKYYTLYLIFRIAIGVIFIVASWEKLLNPEAFSKVLINYQILPEHLVNPVAYFLPIVELITGLFLIVGCFVKGSALIFNLMMLLFICVFFYNKYRGLDVSCGCFSLESKASKNPTLLILRDISFLISGLWVLIYHMRMKKV